MTGLRRDLFQLTNNPAAVVNFNLFIAGLPVQDIFIIAFDSQLTDVVRCGRVSMYCCSLRSSVR